MVVSGRVQNGVVVFPSGVSLPEGAEVTVSCDAAPIAKQAPKGKRIRFPLVRSDHPGAVPLTNERIAEIFEEEDIAYYSQFFVKREENT